MRWSRWSRRVNVFEKVYVRKKFHDWETYYDDSQNFDSWTPYVGRTEKSLYVKLSMHIHFPQSFSIRPNYVYSYDLDLDDEDAGIWYIDENNVRFV